MPALPVHVIADRVADRDKPDEGERERMDSDVGERGPERHMQDAECKLDALASRLTERSMRTSERLFFANVGEPIPSSSSASPARPPDFEVADHDQNGLQM